MGIVAIRSRRRIRYIKEYYFIIWIRLEKLNRKKVKIILKIQTWTRPLICFFVLTWFSVCCLFPFQSDITSMRYRKIREKIAIWPHCILPTPMCMIRGRTIWSLKTNVASIDTQSIWSSRVCSQVLFPIYFSLILLNFMVYSIAVCLVYWSLLLLLLLRLNLVRMTVKLISNELMFIYVDWNELMFFLEIKECKVENSIRFRLEIELTYFELLCQHRYVRVN